MNEMTMDEKIRRINEGLDSKEQEEQARLRRDYINSVRANLRSQLNGIRVQNPDGSVTDLGEKHGHTDEDFRS